MDWVGKYLVGSIALYAATTPLRRKKQFEHDRLQASLHAAFQSFSAAECGEFLSSCDWDVTQIPCFFEHRDGQISEFVYEPGAPEKLEPWKLAVLERFINLYGMKELSPALELSRDGARDKPICFLWNENRNAAHIDQVPRACALMARLCA